MFVAENVQRMHPLFLLFSWTRSGVPIRWLMNRWCFVVRQAMQPISLVILRVGVAATATVRVASCWRCVHTSHTCWRGLGLARSGPRRRCVHTQATVLYCVDNDKHQSKPLFFLNMSKPLLPQLVQYSYAQGVALCMHMRMVSWLAIRVWHFWAAAAWPCGCPRVTKTKTMGLLRAALLLIPETERLIKGKRSTRRCVHTRRSFFLWRS